MAEMWMDVDAALAEVPVNIAPLIDDADFKSREVAIAFNQAGMDLVWNFVTTAGAFTQTAVTPTSGGVYDWAHQGDGMYSIEIPASGGASINNDTEGFGWFTGFCTGVLPWRGPVIGFRASSINDKLIDSAYDATRGLAGTALPAAAAGAAGGLLTCTSANVLPTDSIANASIANDAIAAAKIAADAITAAKIATGAITAAKFASGAIDNAAIATDAIGTAEIAASAVTKIQAGLANAVALDDVETTVAAIALKTTNLPSDPADQSLIIAATNAIVALIGTPAGASLAADIATRLAASAYTTPPTAVQNADALLARNEAGGSSTGRTVGQAIARLRNRVAVVAGVLTVYAEDDVTPLWTAAVTTAAGDPVSEVNPT
jgi:hypothetical protein